MGKYEGNITQTKNYEQSHISKKNGLTWRKLTNELYNIKWSATRNYILNSMLYVTPCLKE